MIDTAVLKNKILELALTGQILNSGKDVNQLFDSIVASAYKTDKTKVSDKNYDLSELSFQIPSNWKWVWLGDIFQHNTGKALNSSNTEGISLEYITTSNLYWDRFELEDLKTMLFKESEIEKCTVKKGDLLVCEGGDIGRSAIWSENYEMRIQNHIHRLRPYVNEICVKFYFYVMMYYKNNGLINGRGIGLQGLSSKRLHAILVPLPDFESQYLITEKIDELFKVITTIEELQQQYSSDLEVLKSKIIDAGIQGKLTKQLPQDGTAEELLKQIVDCQNNMIKASKFKKPKDIKNIDIEDIPFEIPNTWKWEKWGNIINVVSARRVHQSDWRKEGIPFYRAREIAKLAVDGSVENDLFISQELYDEFSRDRVPQPGDLMVSAVGTLGKSYVVKDDDLFYYKDASVLCFENYGGMNPYYLRYVMQSSLMKNQIESNSGGTTVDTLTMVRMVQYILPIPPLNEQDRIVSKINEILEIL